MVKYDFFAKIKSIRWWRYSFVIGLASLAWLILRTGTKPSRAAYPCQRMAAANASAWLGVAVVPAVVRWAWTIRKRIAEKSRVVVFSLSVLLVAAFFVLFGGLVSGWFSSAVGSSGFAAQFGIGPGGSGPLPAPVSEEALRGNGKLELDVEQHLAGPPTPSDIFVVEGTNGADGGFSRLVQLLEEHGDGFYRRANDTGGGAATGDGTGGAAAAGEAAGKTIGAGNAVRGIIGIDDVVLIKVNAQWNQRGGTNTDLTASIVEAIIDHPDGFSGEVIIADNGQAQFGSGGGGGSLDWGRNNGLDPDRSMEDVAEEFVSEGYRVSAYLWDTITKTRVSEFSDGDSEDGYVVADTPTEPTGIIVTYPKFTTRYGTHVSFSEGIWNPGTRTYDTDGLVVINVPVLKSHSIYGVTAAVKHYMGVVSDKLTSHNAHRSVGNGGMGTQMVETWMPALNVIDAIWINARPGRGPSTSYSVATETNVIAASLDPVALDTWASMNVLIAAAERQGHSRTGSMNPFTDSGSRFSEWLELSAKEIRKAGYPATTDLTEVNIRVESLR